MNKEEIIKFESKSVRWETNPALCKSCGLCVLKCPQKCLSFSENNVGYLGTPAVKCEVEKCIACKTCQNVCPDCAIFVEKR